MRNRRPLISYAKLNWYCCEDPFEAYRLTPCTEERTVQSEVVERNGRMEKMENNI